MSLGKYIRKLVSSLVQSKVRLDMKKIYKNLRLSFRHYMFMVLGVVVCFVSLVVTAGVVGMVAGIIWKVFIWIINLS